MTVVLGWMFETAWHALLGLIVLSGLFVGSVMVIAREVERSNRHDQATCRCVGCTGRRNRAWEKRMKVEDLTERFAPRPVIRPKRLSGPWASTNELLSYDKVEAKGELYEVVSVDRTKDGQDVRLRCLRTKKVSVIPISRENASRRFWLVIG